MALSEWRGKGTKKEERITRDQEEGEAREEKVVSCPVHALPMGRTESLGTLLSREGRASLMSLRALGALRRSQDFRKKQKAVT